MPWTRHAHGRRVRRPLSAAELVVLISFGLKPSGSCLAAAPAVVISQPLVAVEKVDVGLRREIGIATHTHSPHQYLRCYQVKT